MNSTDISGKIKPLGFLILVLVLSGANAVYADGDFPKAAPGRPQLGKGTVLTDRGTMLRGPYWSTDWKGELPDRESVREIRDFGMNALHVYAERHDGDVPPGSYVNQTDTLVRWCGEDGIYCIITIGCGTHNGAFDPDFARKFWETYAPRYRDMPWVIYEIHNEPFSWTPPYDNATLAMEQEMYDLIRKKAPDTMVLLFSYAGLDSHNYINVISTGPIRQDIAALDIDWSNAAVAFHGYGSITDKNMKAMRDMGLNIICTELPISSDYSNDQVNAEHIWFCEKYHISWLVFMQIKKGYLDSWRFREEIDRRKLGWKPDSGSWPAGPSAYVPPHNLALGKTVSVSSVENFEGTELLGKYATDGDKTTRWGSGFADNQFLIIDLGQKTEIRKIVIHWESQYAAKYEIQISDDMTNWKTIIVQNHGNGGGMYMKERIPLSVSTRYIKLYGIKRRMEYGFSLYEFEVFGPE
ncbi:MAG: discoidin domain-containing protein [Spirochaetales bacterium]|nr:discoidin domain-containing protein [Spirochaetales bacterium]